MARVLRNVRKGPFEFDTHTARALCGGEGIVPHVPGRGWKVRPFHGPQCVAVGQANQALALAEQNKAALP